MNDDTNTSHPDDLAALLDGLSKKVPVLSFSHRLPKTAEEARRWKEEGVIVNPPSLEYLTELAVRKSREPSSA